MSSIRAVPQADERVAEEPENPAPQDMLSVSPESPRRLPHINILKMFRIGGVILLTLVFTGALITVAVMASQLSDLTIRVNSLDMAFRSGQIGKLSSSVAVMEEKLQALDKQVSELVSLQPDVAAISSAQHTQQQQLEHLTGTSDLYQQDIAQLKNHISRLVAVEAEVRQSGITLSEIIKLSEISQSFMQKLKPTEPPEKVTPAKKSVADNTPLPAVKKSNRSVRRSATLAAPFVLTGIEHRGGHRFAVVMPLGASAVSQLMLLSPGDGTQGWVLRAIAGDREAIFSVNGSEQRLQVQ